MGDTQGMPAWIRPTDDGRGVLVRVKAVPGARRDQIVGALGEGEQSRLKIRTSAPPEGGKANKAICKLLAKALGVKPREVTLVAGASSHEKTLRVERVDAERCWLSLR